MKNQNKKKYPITLSEKARPWYCYNHFLPLCGCDLVDEDGNVLPQYKEFVEQFKSGGTLDQEDEKKRKIWIEIRVKDYEQET